MNGQLLKQLEMVMLELLDALGSLVQSLQQEREAVVEYNLKLIAEAGRAKQENLKRVQAIESARHDLMMKIGQELGCQGKPSTDFIVAQLADQIQAEKIRHYVSCIRSMAQAAQELNTDQRRYLAHSLNFVQQSLTLIENLQGKGLCSGYTKNGTLSGTVVQLSSATMDRTV